ELALVLAVSVAAFSLHSSPDWPMPLATYVIFPLLILVAFRFNRLGVATATAVVMVGALWATLLGLGPFTAPGGLGHNLVFLQLFVLVLFLTSMFLAITVIRRRRAEARLNQLTAELKEANARATGILAKVLDRSSPSERLPRGSQKGSQ